MLPFYLVTFSTDVDAVPMCESESPGARGNFYTDTASCSTKPGIGSCIFQTMLIGAEP